MRRGLTLVLASGLAWFGSAAHAQTPPAILQTPAVSEAPDAAGSASPVPVIGPEASGVAPAPPIGQPWALTLDARTGQYWSDAVACGGGATMVAFGRDGRDRPRAQTWVSTDGSAWEQGETLRPAPGTDPYWLVTDLMAFRGSLFAFGGDDRRLAAWRSTDCGRHWRRLHDPSFALGADACCISQGVEAAATDDRMLVLAHQGGEEIPRRRWAWVMEAGGAWHRLPGGLEADIDGSVGSTGTDFFAVRSISGEADGRSLMLSPDGQAWTSAGAVPPYSAPVWDGDGGRYLAVAQEPHDGDAAAPVVWSSVDGVTWSPLASGMPNPVTYGSVVAAGDGLLVWVVDAGDDDGSGSWSWIGTSMDGGATWSVSAGWPGQALAGGKAIVITPEAVIIAGGDAGDRTRIWTLSRPTLRVTDASTP